MLFDARLAVCLGTSILWCSAGWACQTSLLPWSKHQWRILNRGWADGTRAESGMWLGIQMVKLRVH